MFLLSHLLFAAAQAQQVASPSACSELRFAHEVVRYPDNSLVIQFRPRDPTEELEINTRVTASTDQGEVPVEHRMIRSLRGVYLDRIDSAQARRILEGSPMEYSFFFRPTSQGPNCTTPNFSWNPASVRVTTGAAAAVAAGNAAGSSPPFARSPGTASFDPTSLVPASSGLTGMAVPGVAGQMGSFTPPSGGMDASQGTGYPATFTPAALSRPSATAGSSLGSFTGMTAPFQGSSSLPPQTIAAGMVPARGGDPVNPQTFVNFNRAQLTEPQWLQNMGSGSSVFPPSRSVGQSNDRSGQPLSPVTGPNSSFQNMQASESSRPSGMASFDPTSLLPASGSSGLTGMAVPGVAGQISFTPPSGGMGASQGMGDPATFTPAAFSRPSATAGMAGSSQLGSFTGMTPPLQGSRSLPANGLMPTSASSQPSRMGSLASSMVSPTLEAFPRGISSRPFAGAIGSFDPSSVSPAGMTGPDSSNQMNPFSGFDRSGMMGTSGASPPEVGSFDPSVSLAGILAGPDSMSQMGRPDLGSLVGQSLSSPISTSSPNVIGINGPQSLTPSSIIAGGPSQSLAPSSSMGGSPFFGPSSNMGGPSLSFTPDSNMPSSTPASSFSGFGPSISDSFGRPVSGSMSMFGAAGSVGPSTSGLPSGPF